MNREARLRSVREKDWVHRYSGKNIVQDYRKKYGLDTLCAIAELRLLGVEISEEYEENVRRSIEGAALARKRKKRKQEEEWPESDENFAFIVGYTPAGFPYGVTWDEVKDDPDWAEPEAT